ncbi:TniQ family protein [Rugamonas sp.]|uniref:TniQ family protein n=1 Tax=Rugamonas sp. TaxID=1926287 RepID=UPI0025D6C59B|nr:TniQ family protein [Rugamonas sp.]
MSQNYNLWDGIDDALPPRSRLASLKPFGQGTPFQESLSGLIIRLARIHTCDPKQLLNLEILQNTALKQLRPTGGFVSFDLRTMNGGGKYASEVSRRLEELTLQDNLINCSFLPWSNIIAKKGMGILHSHPHWCSNCIEEWRKNNLEAYLPLLWFAYSVNSCTKHGNILSDKCSHCGKHQPFVPRHTFLDHCSHCGHWLGDEKYGCSGSSEAAPIDDFEIFQREAVGEMISHPPYSNLATFENFLSRLKYVIETEFNGVVTHYERSIGFRQSSIKQWLDGKRPSLPLFMRMTQRLGTTPVQFLKGNLTNAFFSKGEIFSFQHTVKKYAVTETTHKEIRSALLSIIASGESTIPTKTIAERLGYKYSWLKYWHPEPCLEISRFYRQHLSREAQRKRNNAENITREVVRELFEKKIKITRRAVQKILFRHSIFLSRPEIRAAFNDEKRVLFLPFFAPHGQKK